MSCLQVLNGTRLLLASKENVREYHVTDGQLVCAPLAPTRNTTCNKSPATGNNSPATIHTPTAPERMRKRARGEGMGLGAAGGAEVGWNPHNVRVRQVAVGRAGVGGRGRRVPEGTELLGVEGLEAVNPNDGAWYPAEPTKHKSKTVSSERIHLYLIHFPGAKKAVWVQASAIRYSGAAATVASFAALKPGQRVCVLTKENKFRDASIVKMVDLKKGVFHVTVDGYRGADGTWKQRAWREKVDLAHIHLP
jgi:hypothetical protein